MNKLYCKSCYRALECIHCHDYLVNGSGGLTTEGHKGHGGGPKSAVPDGHLKEVEVKNRKARKYFGLEEGDTILMHKRCVREWTKIHASLLKTGRFKKATKKQQKTYEEDFLIGMDINEEVEHAE